MKHHWMIDAYSQVMCKKTRNNEPEWFNICGAYQFTKIASLMNTWVDAGVLGKHTVNFFGINLAGSGFGKGYAKKVFETQIEHRFKKRYLDVLQPSVSEQNLRDLASRRAAVKSSDVDEELDKVIREYNSKCESVVTYDFPSGSPEGAKQYREAVLMAGIGALNMESDEIGSNIQSPQVKDLIDLFLQFYDGKVSPKLIKNSKDQKRSGTIDGWVHANMLLFGEPMALLDGGSNEETFDKLNDTGLGRRCFYGYCDKRKEPIELTVAERLAELKDTSADTALTKIAVHLEKLATMPNYNVTVNIPDDTLHLLIEYQIYCEQEASGYKSTQTVQIKEAEGRFFKTMRFAAGLAWLDLKNEMGMEHLEAAIKLAQESKISLDHMLNQDPIHARLAKHLVEVAKECTYTELSEDLKYFPATAVKQKDIIKNCIAWGHRNNVIVKRKIIDDIDIISAEALQVTDLNNLHFSFSTQFGEGYAPYKGPISFSNFYKLVHNTNTNFCTHHFVEGNRMQTNAIRGFNMIVLDVDEGWTVEQARTFLKDFTYLIYTTKSHQVKSDKNPNACDRFRIVIPTSHFLKMDKEEFKEFMKNVHESIPFTLDECSSDISRKWSTNKGCEYYYNHAELFDVLPFIPKTKKNDERIERHKTISGCDGIERWFLTKILEDGERNNHFQRYGYMLLDGGYDFVSAQIKVRELNSKLNEPLDEDELTTTIWKSMQKHVSKKGN